jgi:peptidoglycan/xylan/chitin deacetylase (PgdA/CDA1 family)
MLKHIINNLFKSSHFISDRYNGNISVLMFHRVIPDNENIKIPGIEINYTPFKNLILSLKNKYEFVSEDELSKKSNKKKIFLTFDDGYKDNYDLVYPLLESLKVPFTIFVTTDMVEENLFLWWYALDDLLNSNIRISLISEIKNFESLSKNRKRKILNNYLRKMTPNQQIDFFKLNLDSDLKKYKSINLKFSMSYSQIKEISNSKYGSIGGHTKSHLSLKNLNYKSSLFEIESNKLLIETIVGKKITCFAYPYGSTDDFSSKEIKILKKIGYKFGFSSIEGNYLINENNYLIPRIPINGNSKSLINIDLRISGLYTFIKKYLYAR